MFQYFTGEGGVPVTLVEMKMTPKIKRKDVVSIGLCLDHNKNIILLLRLSYTATICNLFLYECVIWIKVLHSYALSFEKFTLRNVYNYSLKLSLNLIGETHSHSGPLPTR